MIVIDELWRLWASGLKASQVKDQHKSFLAEHRHMVGSNSRSAEVVFVTQDLSQIANFSRQLVETTFRVKKAMSLGLSKQYHVDVFFGAMTGSSPPLSKREREVHGTFKKDVFRLYQSHTLGAGEVGDETRTDGRFNILKGYGLKIGLVSFIVLLFFVVKGFGVVKSSYFPGQPVISATAATNVVSMPSEIARPIRPITPDFLADFDDVYISSNGGYFPDFDFEFTVKRNGYRAMINPDALLRMGYQMKVLGLCLVYISGHDFNDSVLCQSAEDEQGFFQDVVSQGTPI